MRILSLRLIISLVVGVTLASLATSWYEVQSQKNALRSDLQQKAETLGDSLAGTAELYLDTGDHQGLERLANEFKGRDHLLGIAVYSREGAAIVESPNLQVDLQHAPELLKKVFATDRNQDRFTGLRLQRMHLLGIPLHSTNAGVTGALVVVHDTGYIRNAIFSAWGRVFLHIAIQLLVISAITVLIVRWSLAGPIARLAHWMKELRTGKDSVQPNANDLDFLFPIAREVAPLAQGMQKARAAAEAEARLRNANESEWTAERLADYVRNRLGDSNLFVVSNREPYVHTWRDKEIKVSVPASGLVTAIEPILCACNGTWIAHGSGDADAEVVDSRDGLQVPPEDPRYRLRRVWLSAEEEEGYYYGFANEGLWPLCHIAHTRPIFRASDWDHYYNVNLKFAQTVVDEIGDQENPVILIQDYHFALLPRMLKDRLPRARIAIFWHIPWANPESFGICPWQHELLDGLLGADLIGFHVRAHCNNFLHSVDRVLEARVDWEHFSVKRNNHQSLVLPFPISVEYSGSEHGAAGEMDVTEERTRLMRELGVEGTFIGLGVDRVDYTKGIMERFQAVESFLERYPSFQGKFTFIQIGAPTRSRIKRYADFQAEVEAEANRVNARFKRGKWRPIVFQFRQHSREEVQRYYRVAHLCMVTSLHDGMNLVAKEYVEARKDERGALILSRFTGAARDLSDAIIVNPYDVKSSGEAIAQALQMDVGEMVQRMRHMRTSIKEHNIYWWAGTLIGALCELRIDQTENSFTVPERIPLDL